MNSLQLQFLMLIFAGWANRSQQDVIEYLHSCVSGHSALRPLQLQRPEIMTSYTDATGRHPVRLHSLLAGPHPSGGKIDDHRVPGCRSTPRQASDEILVG